MGTFLRKLFAYGDDVFRMLRKVKPTKVRKLRLPWRGSKSWMSRFVAKKSTKWAKIRQAGIVIGREALIWTVMDAIFDPNDETDSETQSLRQNFVNELDAQGINTESASDMDELVASIGWEQILQALLNSGAYILFRDFFRNNKFDAPVSIAPVIKQLRSLDDVEYDALAEEADPGDVDGVPLATAIQSIAKLKAEAAQVDEVGGILGISDRETICRLVTLIRSGIDLDVMAIPEFAQI